MSKLHSMMLGKTARRAFSFKRGDKEVRVEVMVLTTNELHQAEVAASAYVNSLASSTELGPDERRVLVRNSRSIEILAIAIRDPDDGKPWAEGGAEELREILTDYEIGLLWAVYEIWQEEQSPAEQIDDPGRFVAVAKAIAKEGSLVPLALLAPSTRRAYELFMASQLSTSPTDKSSPTSDSSEPET